MKKRERGRLSERLVIFAIAASLFLGAATMVQADIGSSEITTYETGYVAGTTNVNLNFHISAQSPDWEYVWYAEMDFPPGVTVNSATDMIDLAHPWRYMYWNGETGDGALTTWGERSYWEYLYDSECDFIVNVDIDPGFSGDLVIDWYLEGDGWGSPPHTVSGSIVIPEAVLDVGVTAINSPQPLDDVGTIPVEVQVKNFGPEVTDVPVRVVISTGVEGAIFIDEDFEGSFPPSGWTVTNDGAPDACVWMRNIDYGRYNYMGTGVCADADADACGSGGPWPMDTSLITPSIDLTLYTNAYLEFDAYYNHLYGDFAEGLISPDGGITWDTLFHWSSDHYWPYHYVFDISAYCGNPNVIIKFRYFADDWDWYWLLDNVKVWAPGADVEHYNETVYVDLLAGESKPVSLPDWVCTEADWYVILGCTELPGDLNSTNDCTFVVDMPIGDLDLGVTSIDIPRPLMGPIPFKPEATVEHFGDIYVKDCPVRCTIEQLGVLKFKEDFEPGVGMEMRVGALDAIFDRHPRELGPDQVCGIRIEWEDGIPQLGDITDWTILDLDGDGITWHATSYRYSSPVTSAYCGDETDHLYENGAFDWLISPQINVGTGGYIEWDMWQEVETFCDYVFVGNSANGINFWGYLYLYNTVGWEHFSQNLVPSGIAADGTTYIAFVFMSDSSVTYEGTYVDNVEVYGGGIVYDEYVYEDFDGGDVKQVVFPTFTPEADTDYEILICTEHPLDEDTSNDCQGPMDFNTGARVWNTRTGYGYDNIQDAIDDSATLDGDTIVAKDGENFYENINIYKQLTVTGQYPPTDTTTIYGTVDITSDNVTFQNFKVIPGGPYTYPEAAIEITCVSHVVVQNNIIEDMTGEVSSATGVFNISGIWVHCDDPTPRPPIPPYYGNVTIYNNTIRNIVNTNVTEPGILLFSEDFEGCYPGPSPPSGWLVEDTNGDGYISGYYAYNMWGSYYSSYYAHSGSMSMRYEYNSA
ncbi:MAG TPA: hypothetical protein EYP23_03665, partial [Thermoplasmata archaeon]|nr:hypothetical protein [Thermoplasmata archaeon]